MLLLSFSDPDVARLGLGHGIVIKALGANAFGSSNGLGILVAMGRRR